MLYYLALIINAKTLLFNRRLDHLHLSMPHRQFMPCNWYLSIYNLWARTSQRRALSKRINSPPPNRYIFNKDQSAQNKIQCQTHIHLQVRSVSERNRRKLIPRISIDLQVRLDDHQLIPSSWVYNPIKTSVIIQTMWRPPVFNHRLHHRHIVESVIQNGYKPGLSE